MNKIVNAVPVKYMVVPEKCGPFTLTSKFEIWDTSFDGQGMVVARTRSLTMAHRIAKMLNEDEGYQYYPE